MNIFTLSSFFGPVDLNKNTILSIGLVVLTTVAFSQNATHPSYQQDLLKNDKACYHSDKKESASTAGEGIISHRWYNSQGPQIAPHQMLSDEATRQYYLNTYGFDVFALFPDYPRWTTSNPTLQDVQEYKLRVAVWMENHKAFSDFLEKRKKELSLSDQVQ